jgi:HD-like signal output (HDOD) protein
VLTSKSLRASALRAVDQLPVLSVTLHRALGLLSQGDDLSVGSLAVVVEEDVVMTGSLLSIANSALYGRSNRVASVRHAIARLGVRKTRNVLLGLSVGKCFNSASPSEAWLSARFNAHSLAVAILSDLIVRTVSSENPEWAFMAGLLHDIGLLLIAVGLPEQFRLIKVNAESDAQIVKREREVLGFTHFDLGAEVLSHWNCPLMLQEVARFCECTEFQCEPLNLGSAVKTASLLADASGISIFNVPENERLTTDLLEALAVPIPAEFIATFKVEYVVLRACAT